MLDPNSKIPIPVSASAFSPFVVSSFVANGIATIDTREAGSIMVPANVADKPRPFCKNSGIRKFTIYNAIIFMQSAISAAI